MEVARAHPRKADKIDKKEVGSVDSQGDSKRIGFPDLESMGLAVDAAKIGVWSWDIASNKVVWSSNLEEIHRLPPGSFDGTFSHFEKNIHPDDRAAVIAAVKTSLQTQQTYSVEYRLPPRADGDERWIAALGTVVVANAVPVKILGICHDVTERVWTERQLRLQASQQAVVARLGERALVEKDLRGLLDGIAAAVGETLEVDFVKILELLPGDNELLLRAGVGWKPELIGTALVSTGLDTQAGFTLISDTPIVVENLNSETRFTGAALLHEHGIVSGITAKIAGADGHSYGVIGVHTRKRRQFNAHDVSLLTSVANIIAGAIQRNRSDQRNEMMIRELHHHSGNLFSQLLALFSQTASNSRNKADLVTKYEARVIALANAHRLIVEGGWHQTSLENLLRAQLAPDIGRISLKGPHVLLDPDLSFALSTVMHELATNASTHGSLSVPTGHLDLSWSVDRTEKGLMLIVDWLEGHGPTPKKRWRPGFGLRLIDTVIERQLNGASNRLFQADGMHSRLVVPLARERWPNTDIH